MKKKIYSADILCYHSANQKKKLSCFFRVLLGGINQYSFDLEDKEKENKTKQGGKEEFRATFSH